MGGDDREEESRCVSVPEELVNEMVCNIIDFLEEWHQRNELEPRLDVCGAAVLVSAKLITAQFMGLPAGSDMIQ